MNNKYMLKPSCAVIYLIFISWTVVWNKHSLELKEVVLPSFSSSESSSGPASGNSRKGRISTASLSNHSWWAGTQKKNKCPVGVWRTLYTALPPPCFTVTVKLQVPPALFNSLTELLQNLMNSLLTEVSHSYWCFPALQFSKLYELEAPMNSSSHVNSFDSISHGAQKCF